MFYFIYKYVVNYKLRTKVFNINRVVDTKKEPFGSLVLTIGLNYLTSSTPFLKNL